MHIGDNFVSDIINSKKVGVNSYYTPNSREIIANSKFINLYQFNFNNLENVMIGMIQNKLKKIFQNKKFLINNLHDLGYIFYGPLIYAFFLWIEQNSLKKDKKKILFCAREGFYFKKLFDDFFNKNKGFKTIYFKVSRRLSVVPTFKNKNDILESFKSHRFEGNQKFLF